ncbi:MAG: shikimate kinase [Ruminococcus sp.]|nr:shikimate kinase [Ruminococcus sp.]
MTPIYLCGFMGCGKSTVGRILAARLRCRCTDMDDYIEKQEGMTIPEIFEKKGEPYFRAAETQALKDLAGQWGIIATGGGALLSDENGSTAKSNGMVVFIDTALETCYERIKNDPHRPIAASSTKEQLSERFEQRRPKYKQNSHYTVPGSYPALVIAVKIERLYKKFCSEKA